MFTSEDEHMLTIGLIDDNTGGFYLLQKLKQSLPCNYKFVLCGKPFGGVKRALFDRVEKLTKRLLSEQGCDAVVYASVALSFVGRALSARGLPVFYCEAPVLHAATYTVSNVLVACCDATCDRMPADNVITVAMPRFPELSEQGNEQHIVDYITACADMYVGQFDCIALGHSSMNNYKRCFKRVFPNAQVFDSADGVVRRIRKKYRKHVRDEGDFVLLDENFEDITDKFTTQL